MQTVRETTHLVEHSPSSGLALRRTPAGALAIRVNSVSPFSDVRSQALPRNMVTHRAGYVLRAQGTPPVPGPDGSGRDGGGGAPGSPRAAAGAAPAPLQPQVDRAALPSPCPPRGPPALTAAPSRRPPSPFLPGGRGAPLLCLAARRRGRERSAVPGLTRGGLPAPEAARRHPRPPPPPHPSLPPPPPSLPPGALCTFFSNHPRRQTLMGNLAPHWKNAGYEGITGTPEHLPGHHRHPV